MTNSKSNSNPNSKPAPRVDREKFIADITAVIEAHGSPATIIAFRDDADHSCSGIYNVGRAGDVNQLVTSVLTTCRDLFEEEKMIFPFAVYSSFIDAMARLLRSSISES
jgi:hypothetical protein